MVYGGHMNRHILYKEQYVGLILLVCAIAYGVLYGIGLLPEIGLYIAFATILIGLLIFLVPLVSGPMKISFRKKMGQTIFDFFERAGLTERDMKLLVAYAKKGYKIGFGQPDEPPYVEVLLTIEKFELTATPTDDDYLLWKEAVAKIESGVTCPLCGKVVIEACEECGWKPK